jgi:hypothetical protein
VELAERLREANTRGTGVMPERVLTSQDAHSVTPAARELMNILVWSIKILVLTYPSAKRVRLTSHQENVIAGC